MTRVLFAAAAFYSVPQDIGHRVIMSHTFKCDSRLTLKRFDRSKLLFARSGHDVNSINQMKGLRRFRYTALFMKLKWRECFGRTGVVPFHSGDYKEQIVVLTNAVPEI